MTREKAKLESVSTFLNLTGSVSMLSGTTEKIVEISSYKNPELLASTEKILLNERLKKLNK